MCSESAHLPEKTTDQPPTFAQAASGAGARSLRGAREARLGATGVAAPGSAGGSSERTSKPSGKLARIALV